MDKVIEYQFQIRNESGKDIEIVSYDHDYPNKIKKVINIETDNFYDESFLSRYSQETYNFLDVFDGDSIVINYNNEKQQIFYCYRNYNDDIGDEGCSEPRNILAVFQDTDNDPNNNIFFNQYTFTQEDYENAAACEGECD